MRAKLIAVLTFLLLCFSSSQAGNQKVLYTFTGGLDGGTPLPGVIFDQAGNLYGVTFLGGAFGTGTVFQLTPTSSGPWKETVLYSFTGGPDGGAPSGGLAIDSAGNLYGGASSGGDPVNQCGTVFKLAPSPSGWIFTVLHTFLGGEDGCSPQADFALFGNTALVSTTQNDGAGNQGTVIHLPVSGGNDEPVPFVGSNGSSPSGAVNEFGYGTTILGGAPRQGNVFELTCCGTIKTIHTFKSTGTGGYNPMGSLAPQLVDGGLTNMYGTTSAGGAGGHGTVYRLTASQILPDVWSLSVLHAFSGPDGFAPSAGVILDSAGSLYGTTEFGGAGFAGTVFKLTPGPNNTWTHNLLYSFSGGADGGNVTSGVVLDNAGNIYGTAIQGGTFNQGVVYEVAKITATLKPAALTFGPQPLNTTSPPQRISLFNHTAFPINVTGVTTQGDFAISSNKCQNGVKAGTHCDVFVTYTPTGRGTEPRTGALTFVDNAFNGPQTAGLAGTVPAVTSTAVTTSGSPSSVGQPVTFTAMVTSTQGAIPDGDLVTFSDGTTFLGSAPTASGAAAFTTASLAARSHTIKASYAGDPAFDPSAGAVTQVVQKYSTVTVLKSNPNPSTSGQPVTISATVTSAGPTPTGKVWFKDGNTGIAIVVLTNGVATLVKSNFTIGTHPLTAEYLGDAASALSTSPVLNQVVQSPH